MTKTKSMSFEDLLAQVAKGQGQDITELSSERARLAEEVDRLEAELALAKSNLAVTLAKLQEPVRQAIRAAALVGVQVPEEYVVQVGRTNGKRSNGGSYKWEPGALPGSTRTEDLTPREWEVSRAMWAFSKGSNGSAGRAGEGVLTAVEFWALVKEQVGKDEVAVGETLELTLPNGRPVKVSRLH